MSTTKQRHIIITGAAGFIGSNFVRIALENDYCVTGLDSLSCAGQRSTIDHLKKSDKFRFCQAATRPKSSKLDNRYLSQHLDFEVDNWNGLMQVVIDEHLYNTSDAGSL